MGIRAMRLMRLTFFKHTPTRRSDFDVVKCGRTLFRTVEGSWRSLLEFVYNFIMVALVC